ncbi:MAG: redoxin domain-containing protein [Planctomycetes bacterium]|nr:redoxin domain-containing protein [Planctomycetota bacterium]
MKELSADYAELGVEPLLISADSPESNRRFQQKLAIPFPLLSDEDHAVADRYGIPISRKHPKAWSYQDGFIQPAVLVYKGEAPVYTFVQQPSMLNLWGAARRPTPREVLDVVREKLAEPAS